MGPSEICLRRSATFFVEIFKTSDRNVQERLTPCHSGFRMWHWRDRLNLSSYLSLPINGYDIFETQLQIGQYFATQLGNQSQFQLLESDGKFPLPDN